MTVTRSIHLSSTRVTADGTYVIAGPSSNVTIIKTITIYNESLARGPIRAALLFRSPAGDLTVTTTSINPDATVTFSTWWILNPNEQLLIAIGAPTVIHVHGTYLPPVQS